MSVPVRTAEWVLKTLNITRIEDLFYLDEIAWELGAMVVEEPLKGAEARILISCPRAIITISTGVFDTHRKRFAVAHELGHLKLHRRQNALFICTASDLNVWTQMAHSVPKLEQEANEFASCLLMPGRFFSPLCNGENPGLGIVRDLAERFRVSITAASLRFIQFCNEPLAVVYSEKGYIRWFGANDEFSELNLFVDVKARLSPETIAARAFRGEQIPDRTFHVPVNAWMRSGPYSQKAVLSEHSLAMPNYDAVLTLLWIDQVLDDEDWF
jgi:hypothetical protein